MAKLWRNTGTSPVTWNSGRLSSVAGWPTGGVPMRVAMSSSTSACDRKLKTPCTTPRWSLTAPFDRPVEPEVNRMVARSSGTSSGSGAAPSPAMLASVASGCRSSTAITSALHAVMRAARGGSANTSRQPTPATAPAISPACHQPLSRHATPPAITMPM